MDNTRIFYSYSQVDEEYRKDIEKHLTILRRSTLITDWHFRKIVPGQEFDQTINEQLEQADIILLLISSDFLSSNYCYDIEMKRAMEKHETGDAVVIPIILRECDWKNSSVPFNKLQALPENAKPVNQWLDKDIAYNNITQELKRTITFLKKKV